MTTTTEDIRAIVCYHFKVDPDSLYDYNQRSEPTYQRAMIMFLIRKQLGLSWPKVGAVVKRSENAAASAVQTLEGHLENHQAVRDDVAELTDKICDWEERTIPLRVVH